MGPICVIEEAKTPAKSAVLDPRFSGRAWRQVAGPGLPADSRYYATVADGPKGGWAGGTYERSEAENRKRLQAAERDEIKANGEFTEPDWHKVASPDGVVCYVTRYVAGTVAASRAIPRVVEASR